MLIASLIETKMIYPQPTLQEVWLWISRLLIMLEAEGGYRGPLTSLSSNRKEVYSWVSPSDMHIREVSLHGAHGYRSLYLTPNHLYWGVWLWITRLLVIFEASRAGTRDLWLQSSAISRKFTLGSAPLICTYVKFRFIECTRLEACALCLVDRENKNCLPCNSHVYQVVCIWITRPLVTFKSSRKVQFQSPVITSTGYSFSSNYK